jgi:hypothetical protein
MARDDYRCFRCGVLLAHVWAGYSCHHRQTRAVGPDTPDNRIMLCGSGSSPHCHQYVHAHPEESRDNGWIVSRHADDPGAVPVRHWQLGMVLLDAQGGITPAALAQDDGPRHHPARGHPP